MSQPQRTEGKERESLAYLAVSINSRSLGFPTVLLGYSPATVLALPLCYSVLTKRYARLHILVKRYFAGETRAKDEDGCRLAPQCPFLVTP